MHILRGDIAQIDIVDPRAIIHIKSHARGSYKVVHFPVRVLLQGFIGKGFAGEFSFAKIGTAEGIYLLDPLNHFKKASASRDSVGFQGRRNRQDRWSLCHGTKSFFVKDQKA